MIAKAMGEKGSQEYRPDALARQYKKLMLFAKELQENPLGTTTARASVGAKDDENAPGSEDD